MNTGSTFAERSAARQEKIRILYEDYIMIHGLMDTWLNPVTEKPKLEPIFAAGMQSLEISFLILARFLDDNRIYVVKRPRIDMVTKDICSQMELMAEIIDSELEDEMVSDETMGSLTQHFPFEGAPPTQKNLASQSLALGRLIDAVETCLPSLSAPEKQSLTKILRNITGTFNTCFGSWTVGVGIEEQLSHLRHLVGLKPFKIEFGKHFLDYQKLVKPEIVLQTDIDYPHKEDFFFRSVHLGTECWAFIANLRLESAFRQVTKYCHWDNGAAHIRSAAHVLEYLGDHVMMLTSMVLRDYLELKVEIEGTSGEGSSAVKSFRSNITKLVDPLLQTLCTNEASRSPEIEQEVVLKLYQHPEEHPALYNFAKSLEIVESSLLGGFYYKHFLLATNVIGTASRGTMQKMVPALKKTYETPIFPVLDTARTLLGKMTDSRLQENKGRIMHKILEQRSSSLEQQCPFTAHQRKSVDETPGQNADSFETMRKALYDIEKVPRRSFVVPTAANEKLEFFDHAWGKTPPVALALALERQFKLYSEGHTTWDTLFGSVLPEARGYIQKMLKAPASSVVQFGHNTHDLVSKILSIKLEQVIRGFPLNILTTDTEFYSFTRQVNRLSEPKIESINLDVVPVEPLDTFEARFRDAAGKKKYDIVFSSHCLFLTQQTIIENVGPFCQSVYKALREEGWKDEWPSWSDAPERVPVIFVDGYHAFGAVPTDLSNVPDNVVYVAGLLKHVASGANCGFAVMSSQASFSPLITGWLANPADLDSTSDGVVIGRPVNYDPSFSLMGATPASIPSLLIFVEVMRHWQERNITVEKIHEHVLGLEDRFFEGMQDITGPISVSTIVNWQPPHRRSHTLSFRAMSREAASAVVQDLESRFHVGVDNRKNCIRIGFGFNHSMQDVDMLLEALRQLAL